MKGNPGATSSSKASTKGRKRITTLRKSNSGLRKPNGEHMKRYLDHFEDLKSLTSELIPFTTACGRLGLQSEEISGWLGRYPALREELEKTRCQALIDAQRRVMAGDKAWIPLIRVMESQDSGNWLRQAGRKANDQSPYSRMASKARK